MCNRLRNMYDATCILACIIIYMVPLKKCNLKHFNKNSSKIIIKFM